jgi:hypothetical protein
MLTWQRTSLRSAPEWQIVPTSLMDCAVLNKPFSLLPAL